MSQITENTIVIHKSQKQDLLEDYKRFGSKYKMELNLVYEDDNICVYITDCNGDLPWDIETTKCVPWLMETDYGFWKPRIVVRVNGKETRWHLETYLRKSKLLSTEQLRDIMQSIEFCPA